MRRIILVVLVVVLVAGCTDDTAETPSGTEAVVEEVPSPSPSPVVPKVSKTALPDATAVLEDAGLTWDTVDKPAQVPKGTVLRQDPEPGTEVSDGSSVELTVAVPYPRIPNVEGMRRKPAIKTLKNADYKVAVRLRRTTTEREVVMSQTPAGGTEALSGQVVKLVVWNNICTPGYSPCLPEGRGDYDCIGGGGDPPFTGFHRVTGFDIYNLDSDNDGQGCE